jgi:hypothetical protein
MSENKPDSDKLSPKDEMTRRAQGLAEKLVRAANDPDADAERAGYEDEQDRERQALIAAYHASKQRPNTPTGAPIADLAALRAYLGDRAGEIEIEWEAEHRQVRFCTALDLAIPDERKAAVGEAIARANARLGASVWRPASHGLVAEMVAPVGDTGVWTRDVDRAIDVLRATLASDAATMRAAAKGGK